MIVVGGRSDKALHRAGRHGDGWIGVWCSPRRFREAVAQVESEAGDRNVAWRHGLQVWVGFDRDRTRARERLEKRMQGSGSLW